MALEIVVEPTSRVFNERGDIWKESVEENDLEMTFIPSIR